MLPLAAGLDEREDLRRDAAALGAPLFDPAVDRLMAYLAMLRKWNAAYNLTSIREVSKMRVQHLLDCLTVVPPLRREWAAVGNGRVPRILDVGSGGGLPGVVLAVVETDWIVHCVDAVGKKAAFVRQVAAELGLSNLHAIHARVETSPAPLVDIVTSRAFASLPDFVRWTRAHLAPGGFWVAMKGRVPQDEIEALPPEVEMFHVEPLAAPGLQGERCLVWMRPR